ncbi:O-antigen ligase family protein [Pseudomonas panipatensis]|uniref:O-antigen ligase n=1 Tax=Pseudomonas panipatensis TaxID=428992 RepID=A0A1G8IN42_9PSED|nr:O-antigen ligase family protein [Pseudomonas panipatensis]SDI20334.1 O-antigen ligase [Pseudomonas panipatensis]SMP73441.1 O-antigen ligase [Pseudomonas panipatensis]
MILPVSVGALLALACLLLLVSPWPYLAPFVVFGLVGLAALYRRPAWGLLGLVLLVPFEGLFKDTELSGAKLLGASLILVLVLQLLLRQIPETRLRSNLWRPLLPFLLGVLLSLLFSENLEVSLDNLRELAIGMSLFGITLLVGREVNPLMLCRLLSLGVATTSLIALFSTRYQVGGRAIGLLQDANYFALLIAVAVPPTALLALRSRHLAGRLFWLAVIVVLLAGMTKTDSRSGLLVLLLACAIGAWHHRERLRLIRPRHLGFVMLGMAILLPLGIASLPAAYVERVKLLSALSSGASAHQDPSLGRRASYVVVGTRMIADNPLLGSGPGTFPLHYAQTGYAKAFNEGFSQPDLFRRAHNTYLELLSELGVPSGLLFIALIVMGLHNFSRARQAWLADGDQARADLATHLGLCLLCMALFLLFLSVPNHKYLWMFLALSSVLRLQAEGHELPWKAA